METRPAPVWRVLSVALFVGMFGVSLVKAQGCQRSAQEDTSAEAEATSPGVTTSAAESRPSTAGDAGDADAGQDAGQDAGTLRKEIEVMPATKSGMVFPATKSGPPIMKEDPPKTPQQQK